MPPFHNRGARRAAGAAVLLVAILTAVAVSAGPDAGAQSSEPTTTTGPVPTTATLPPASTTTTDGVTTTTRARPATPTTTDATPAPLGQTSEGAPPPGADRTIPPGAQKIINSVKRTKPNDTKALLDALSALTSLGFSPQEAAVLGFGHFPVGGAAKFTDDWLMARFTPTFHFHEGTDIFAAKGVPVRAPFDGVLTFLDEPVGGIDEFLTLPDKTYFLFAHLSARAKIPNGAHVKQGDVIGLVGNSGDAAGGATHLHFEIHPRGGAAVNPKPLLDGWLTDATRAVPGLVARYLGSTPASIRDTVMTRGSARTTMFAAPEGPPAAELLWSSALSPSGPLQLAAREAVRLADSVEWQIIRPPQ